MLDREIVTAACEIQTKQINTLCRKNVEFFKDKFNVTNTYIDDLVFSGFMGVLTTCRDEIKTNFIKFEVSVCSDYEECRLRGYDTVWPGKNLWTCRRKVLYTYHTP